MLNGPRCQPPVQTPRAPCRTPQLVAASPYDEGVSAQSTEPPDQHDVIHLGEEAAVVVPMDEYRRLRALERRGSAEDLEAAEADAVLQAHQEWVAAGRPGAVSHEEAMAELLGGDR